jgi:hypothetical protein
MLKAKRVARNNAKSVALKRNRLFANKIHSQLSITCLHLLRLVYRMPVDGWGLFFVLDQ